MRNEFNIRPALPCLALIAAVLWLGATPAVAQTTTTFCSSSAPSPCTVPNEDAKIGSDPSVYSGLAAGDTIVVGAGQIATFSNQVFYDVGTIRNYGTLTNPVSTSIFSGSWLRVMGTGALLDNYGTMSNLADIYVQDISVLRTSAPTGAGSLYNRAGAVFTNGSTTRDANGLYGYGGITVYDKSTVTNDGTLNNYSNIYTFKNTSGDDSYIYNNGTLNNYAPADPNFGPTFSNGGTLINTGTLHNAAGAALDNGGTFTNTATGIFINEGKYQSEYFDASGPGSFLNQGRVEVRAGATGAAPNFYAPGSFTQEGAGTLRVDGRFVQSRFDIQGGTVSGSGTLDSTHSNIGANPQLIIAAGATLSPGDGNAGADNAFSVIGDVLLNGNLQISLFGGGTSGDGQGTQYSFLHASGDSIYHSSTGAVVLGGALQLFLATGFTTKVGNYYDVLTADGGLTGAFSTPAQFTNGGYTFQEEIVGGKTLRLNVTAAPVPLPATAWLFTSGSLLVLGAGRRRRFAMDMRGRLHG